MSNDVHILYSQRHALCTSVRVRGFSPGQLPTVPADRNPESPRLWQCACWQRQMHFEGSAAMHFKRDLALEETGKKKKSFRPHPDAALSDPPSPSIVSSTFQTRSQLSAHQRETTVRAASQVQLLLGAAGETALHALMSGSDGTNSWEQTGAGSLVSRDAVRVVSGEASTYKSMGCSSGSFISNIILWRRISKK